MSILRFLIPILLGIVPALADETLADAKELYEGKEYKRAFANPKDNPDLPRVLLIGDSISIGYTIPVRKLLAGKANVHRIPGNGKFAAYGVQNLPKWLGNGKWDVIHFNWGLWDLCYRDPKSKTQGHRDKVNGKITATPEEYRKSLEKAVSILEKTKAKLIWCATTPVPDGEAGRVKGDALVYNRVAAEVMKAHGIPIDDLHAHALKKLPGIQCEPGNVHFTEKGYDYLAVQVARSIMQRLEAASR